MHSVQWNIRTQLHSYTHNPVYTCLLLGPRPHVYAAYAFLHRINDPTVMRRYLIIFGEILASNAQETIRQLLIAGLDTTASFLQWCFLYMLVHPEVQDKVQRELDAVIG